MDGGRRSWSLSSPGKTSVGVVKNCAKPREKKLGLSPGEEKRSRGIWKSRSPTRMNISLLKSSFVSLGTAFILLAICNYYGE